MTVRNRRAGRQVHSQHVVQFFDTDESRAQRVASFLAEGYHAGEPLIVIARPSIWRALFEHLERRRVPVQTAVAHGTLIVRDAADTLRRISVNGTPTAAAFGHLLHPTLDQLAAGAPRLRAYGEMVDILAQRGDMADAVALEAIWNHVGEQIPMMLLCGYSAAHFVASGTHEALCDICRAHSGVHSDPHDPLAAWVLTAALQGQPALGR